MSRPPYLSGAFGLLSPGFWFIDFSVASVIDNSEAKWAAIRDQIECECARNALPPIDLDELL